jgi:hypothetical protein
MKLDSLGPHYGQHHETRDAGEVMRDAADAIRELEEKK